MLIPENVKQVADIVKSVDGKAFLVGGAVVDHLLGLTPKDWDIEVHGIPFDVLYALLASFGFKPNVVGAEFGVIKVDDLDISIPRTENKTGAKHTDFTVELNPNLTPAEAALRRDLTINSMFINLDTLELVDPFNGRKDLEQGILRATNEDTFKEDPLRVLRIMQLLPRKAKFVDPDTRELAISLSAQFDTLPKERVLAEFEKLLLKADKPSMGLRFLLEADWLKHFPELAALVGCPHNPEHHPEGDVWEHTLLALDHAASILKHIPDEWKLPFMFGVLCHDLGKPATTDLVELTSYGHDIAGEPLAEVFMQRLTNEIKLIERVCVLVRNHMQPYFLDSGGAKRPAWRRLHNKVRLDILGWVSLCDKASSDPAVLSTGHARSNACWVQFMWLNGLEGPIKPKLLGRHLIDRGWKPGPEFGKILKIAYELQLDNEALTEKELFESAQLLF